MLNEERKKDYLNQIFSSSVRYATEKLFRNLRGYEEHFNKDLCDFIEPEIKEFLSALSISSLNSLNSRCSIIRTYTQWCIENSLSVDNINHYDSIKMEDLKECLNPFLVKKMVLTLEELDEAVSGCVNTCDKALLYCLFFGICGKKGEEISSLIVEDIDILEGFVRSNGRILHIPKYVLRIFNESCETYKYITGENLDKEIIFDKEDKCVFKRRNNTTVNTQDNAFIRMKSRLEKIRKDNGNYIALTVPRLRNSGVIWDMNKYFDSFDSYDKEPFHDENVREIFKIHEMRFPAIKTSFDNRFGPYLHLS